MSTGKLMNERPGSIAARKTYQVQEASRPDGEDPALDIRVNNDDLNKGDNDDAGGDKSNREVLEINNDLDDNQYPGL